MLRRYTELMSRRPLAGNALSMGTVVGLGDFAAQMVSGKGTQQFDWERLSITTAYGFAAGAPFRMWLTVLESIKRLQAPTLRTAIIKTAINQCVYSPIFNSIYFAITIARTASKEPGSCEGVSLTKRWVDKCEADLLRTQLYANMWFFPANTMIFRFVQIQYRGLANAFAVAGWNVYLSLVAQRGTSTGVTDSTRPGRAE